jgi:hypothetical protein
MNTMRPDEQASLAEIERSKKFDSNIKSGIKTAANLGLTATGVGAATKVLPFLSEHIPMDLAIKGINKVSPKLGDFLKRGMAAGLDAKEGLDFIKNKLSPALPNEQDKKLNIIQQYSPELFQFIQEEMRKGRTSLQAAGLAKLNGKYNSIIKKMEQDHKMPYSTIVESIFGQDPQSQGQPEMQQQQQQQQGGGQGQQALMSILQKIQQARGGN